MTTKLTIPFVAVYPNRGQAEAAIDELWHAGYPKDQIGVATPGEELKQATTTTEAQEQRAADGAAAGTLAGTGIGALAGALVIAAIPGFGPVLAGGLLAGMVTGAAAGMALGGFAGPFIALGFSDAAVRRYETEFRAGRTIVTVRTVDNAEKAELILRSHGPLLLEHSGKGK